MVVVVVVEMNKAGRWRQCSEVSGGGGGGGGSSSIEVILSTTFPSH